uniref:Uncharacterized protein n=1 Tax=Glossina palpalis gambiensis TaxID=67801 RepID=A0A1B0BGA0_9MUSC
MASAKPAVKRAAASLLIQFAEDACFFITIGSSMFIFNIDSGTLITVGMMPLPIAAAAFGVPVNVVDVGGDDKLFLFSLLRNIIKFNGFSVLKFILYA